MKKIFAFALFMSSLSVWAAKDVTNLIKNPDFEINGRDGWTTNAFQIASNNNFALNHNGHYVEIWTGGGTARDAFLYQDILNVPVGTYTLTALAHNIKQSDLDRICTGAYIIANDARTSFNVDNTYSVTCVVTDGTLRIGAVTEGCTGNYVCVDNFRLSYELNLDDIRGKVQELVDEMTSIDQKDNTAAHDELIAARNGLKAYLTGENTDGLTEAFTRAHQALKAYRLSIASTKYPYDMTDHVINAGFEEGRTGWEWSELKPQSNKAFGSTVGAYYVEKWTWGANVGNGYVRQVVKNLPNGRYRLTALATNQRQDNTGASQTGAWLVAEDQQVVVSSEKRYTLDFVSISGDATIGFNAVNATGNWICVDDFKLYYMGTDAAAEQKYLSTLITNAKKYVDQKMNTAEHEALAKAIADAEGFTGGEGMTAISNALKTAIEDAEKSIAINKQLSDAITKAQKGKDGVDGTTGAADMQAVLDEANALAASGTATQAQVDDICERLSAALFLFRVSNGRGAEPKVTTHPVVLYGAQAAVGRLTASGSSIIERGFCWAENPDPKVTDNRSTMYYEYGGPVYLMETLQASTEYWVRAYAMTNTYAVGYGEPVRIITLPQGDTQWGYDYNGDDDQNERIANALTEASRYMNYWTAIKGFRPWGTYSAGTETANCSYGGYIQYGPGAGYQSTGTTLHEMGHGIGVGTHWRYYEVPGDLHLADYTWDGERANRVADFFEPGLKCNGDKVHVCFGINGGSSNPVDYIRCVTLYQGMYEDGLPAVGDGACPFYSFESNDSTRYFITNGKYGTSQKFLSESTTGKLTYREVGDVESMRSDDAYAWNVIYDKKTALYYIRNVKSGKYFSFNGDGISLKSKTTPTNTEHIQLMPARINIKVNMGDKEVEMKPYWFARANRAEWPEVLSMGSATATSVSTPTLNFTNTAFDQYWMILDESQVSDMTGAMRKLYDERLTRLIEGSKQVADAAYIAETTEGANATFRASYETIEQQKDGYTTMGEVNSAVTNLYKYLREYLPNVTLSAPVDLSFVMDDANLQTGTSWTDIPSVRKGLFTSSNTAFEFTQKIPERMPAGTYGLLVRGFHCPGTQSKATTDFNAGNNNVAAQITFNTSSLKLKHVAEGAQDEKLDEGGVERTYSGKYQPTNEAAYNAYFAHGFYDNLLPVTLRIAKEVTLGMKCTKSIASDKIVIDGFHLLYFGKGVGEDTVTDIDGIDCNADDVEAYYSLSGTRIARPENGAYIVKYKDGRTMKMMK